MLTTDLLFQAFLLNQNNSFLQNKKEFLYQFTFLKTDNLTQYCWKNHKNSYCWTNLKNDWKTQHAVCSSDEHVSRMINRDSSESVNQSDSWNLMRWKSCDFTAVSKHHKNLWLNNIWQNDACFVSQENFRAAYKINKSIHNKQNLNFNTVRHWNKKKINIY